MRKQILITSILLFSPLACLQAQTCEDQPLGRLLTDFPLNAESNQTIGIQDDGKSLVARIKKIQEEGATVNALTFERFLCHGKKDKNFGEDGIVKVDIHPSSVKGMVQVTKEGKIVVAGTDGVRLRRYTEDGDLDNTFGSEGKVEGNFVLKDDKELKNEPTAIYVEKSGKILVAGTAIRSLPPHNVLYFMARFNADGTVDKGFGNNGKVFDGESEKETPDLTVKSILSDSEGNIFLSGVGYHEGKKSFVLHKYDKLGNHVKGPVAHHFTSSPDVKLELTQATLVNGNELVLYGKLSQEDLSSIILLKASSSLDFEPKFNFTPRRTLASGSYIVENLAPLPDGFVLTVVHENPAKEKELQIIKTDSSGKELIRVTAQATDLSTELPIKLIEQKGGNYALVGSENSAFSPQGLEYFLLKYKP